MRSLSKNVDLKNVCGPTALPETLEKAGTDDADIIIAVSEKDDVIFSVVSVKTFI